MDSEQEQPFCFSHLEDDLHSAFMKAPFVEGAHFTSLFQELDLYCETAPSTEIEKPLVVVGDSGVGKSAALANWAARRVGNALPTRNRLDFSEYVFYHAIGCSRLSTQVIHLLRRLVNSIIFHFQLNDTGKYIIAVAPIISDPNILHITLNDSPIKGSPFRMDVIHGQAVGTSSYVVDEANMMRMTVMNENSFLIQAVDKFGNFAIYCDEQPFITTLVVEGKDVDSDKTRVRHFGAGLYDVSVTMLRSGHRNINIRINGSDIKKSPFNITVIPGTFFASSSSASGVGLSRAIAGEEAHFIIQSKEHIAYSCHS
jgi:hypothetical protein